MSTPSPIEWIGPKDVKAGYYWCRLGIVDCAPAIVKIDATQEPGELALWEFEMNTWQPLSSYGTEWQFAHISTP